MPTLIDQLVIRDSQKPGSLHIQDPFGKGAQFSSIGGDLALKLFADPSKAISGSFAVKNSSDVETIRFNEKGEIKVNPNIIPIANPQSINATKIFYLPVFNEVGMIQYFQITGEKLRRLLL